MRFLGSMNPQVFAHLSDAAVSLSAAMRAMSEQNSGPPAGGRAAEADDGEA
jgi:hypothetical protein